MANNYIEMPNYYLDETSADSDHQSGRSGVGGGRFGFGGSSVEASYRPANNYAIKPAVQALVKRFTTPKTVLSFVCESIYDDAI
jgi:hypothetical protein